MAAPDDDIMVDIINAGTNVDVDDTSQYFADYEDILNMPVVKINKLSRKKILARYIRLSIISYRCMRTYIYCSSLCFYSCSRYLDLHQPPARVGKSEGQKSH